MEIKCNICRKVKITLKLTRVIIFVTKVVLRMARTGDGQDWEWPGLAEMYEHRLIVYYVICWFGYKT